MQPAAILEDHDRKALERGHLVELTLANGAKYFIGAHWTTGRTNGHVNGNGSNGSKLKPMKPTKATKKGNVRCQHCGQHFGPGYLDEHIARRHTAKTKPKKAAPKPKATTKKCGGCRFTNGRHALACKSFAAKMERGEKGHGKYLCKRCDYRYELPKHFAAHLKDVHGVTDAALRRKQTEEAIA